MSTATDTASEIEAVASGKTNGVTVVSDELDERGALEAVSGLLDLVEPLVRSARRRVRQGLARMSRTAPGLPRGADDEQLYYPNLRDQLLFIVSRTAVLEMHVARLQGDLQGDTPQARYRDFIGKLGDPEFAASLLDQYPLLVRQLVRAAEQWATFSLEFAARLRGSWRELVDRFFEGRHPGRLVRIRGGEGDRHNRGRSVLILEFDSGARLVYKPRSLAVDTHFQALLTWLNGRGAKPEFRPLRVLDRGKHGWVEFVAAAGCTSREEVERFYRRQGGYLAILYLLSATDFHFENLIAAGEHPLLIDLEAMFHQPLPGPEKEVAKEGLAESVLKVRMLPQLFFVEGSDEVVDYSALGAPTEQESPYLVPGWENVGTDQMRSTLRRALISGREHRPRLDGRQVNMLDYEDAFVRGFVDTYRLLARHKRELTSDDGPIAAFAQDEVRFIARITHIYAILLGQSFHPDRLRGEEERDELLARLEARTVEFPCLTRLLAAEREDLNHNDIPLFRAKPDSRHVWTSTGECIEDFFPQPALQRARQRIAALDERDLERQLWLIRASLAIVPCPGQGAVIDRRRGQAGKASGGDPLTQACAFGDRLVNLAWQRDEEVGWIDLIDREQGWSIGPAGCDVANGLAGIALFLAHLGSAIGEERYTSLARRTAKTVLKRIELASGASMDISAHANANGIAEIISQLGRLWRNQTLMSRGEQLRRRLRVSADEASDRQSETWAATASIEDALDIAEEARRLCPFKRKVPPGVELMGLVDGLAGQGFKLLAEFAAASR